MNVEKKSKEYGSRLHNYPEDLEKNFVKITTLVDLYFKNEESFKSHLEKEKHKNLEDKPELIERMQRELKFLQTEKGAWEEEKEQTVKIEEVSKK